MSRQIKELMVKEYSDRFADVKERGCVVLNYQGLDANATSQVRLELKNKNSDMFVVRNRLLALSLEELGMPELKECLRGPSALVMASDPVASAKAVSQVREAYPQLTILGGYAEGNVLDQPAIDRLADIPDREVLLGQVLSLISAPAQRFVSGLNNSIVNLASVLKQIKDKKAEAENGESE